MNKFKNATQLPKVYFGLHMAAGVAYYPEMPGKPMVLVEEDALMRMDETFQGKPIYVRHVNSVDVQNLETEMAGVVVRSFFNEADGKHWAEMVIISDEGHKAIVNGWKLSNAYVSLDQTGSGEWHGVPYRNEVVRGQYKHMALTPTPRYAESVIMTPEEFKKYNAELLKERVALQNSKGEGAMKFNFFKNKKEDVTGLTGDESIELPKSKVVVPLSKLINEADAVETEKKENGGDVFADPSHKVKLHDGRTCNVGELLEMHKALNEEHEGLKTKYESAKQKYNIQEEDENQNVDPSEDKAVIEKAKAIEEHEKKEIAEADQKQNALLELEKTCKEAGVPVPDKYKNALEAIHQKQAADKDKGNKAEQIKLQNEAIKKAGLKATQVAGDGPKEVETRQSKMERGQKNYGA